MICYVMLCYVMGLRFEVSSRSSNVLGLWSITWNKSHCLMGPPICCRNYGAVPILKKMKKIIIVLRILKNLVM